MCNFAIFRYHRAFLFIHIIWLYHTGELGKAPAAVNDSLPVHEVEGATAGPSRVGTATAVAVEEEDDLEDMKARLEALRS